MSIMTHSQHILFPAFIYVYCLETALKCLVDLSLTVFIEHVQQQILENSQSQEYVVA